MIRVLIIDDEPAWSETLCDLVEELGFLAFTASRLEEGVHLTNAPDSIDIVLLDVMLPDGSGLDAIQTLKASSSSPEIIIITGKSSEEAARLALEHQAWDYITKGASLGGIRLSLMRAVDYRRKKRSEAQYRQTATFDRGGIVGKDSGLIRALDLAAKAAPTDLPVLITGETGTGKELMSRALHANSLRGDKPFIVVDCASLPSSLMESELFGHAKGAFTGADMAKDGLVYMAHGGTLFLDEVGELPHHVQQKFLRLLHVKRYRPVGAASERDVDFRLVAATNRNLEAMVEEGVFRKDLLYRIKAMAIDLPPLRTRGEDIRLLAQSFAREWSQQHPNRAKECSEEFLKTLEAYDWPGNVRELRNVMGTALALATESEVLFPIHLPAHVRIHSVDTEKTAEKEEGSKRPPSWRSYREKELGDIEYQYFSNLLVYTSYDKHLAMEIADISRAQFYRMLKKCGLA